jgi:hypothetical protein
LPDISHEREQEIWQFCALSIDCEERRIAVFIWIGKNGKEEERGQS